MAKPSSPKRASAMRVASERAQVVRDFAEKALKQQKTYAKDLAKAIEPISTKVLPNGKKSVKA